MCGGWWASWSWTMRRASFCAIMAWLWRLAAVAAAALVGTWKEKGEGVWIGCQGQGRRCRKQKGQPLDRGTSQAIVLHAVDLPSTGCAG